MLLLLVIAPPEGASCIRNALEPMGIGSESRFVATNEAGFAALRERLWDAIIVWIADDTDSDAFPVDSYVDLAHGAPVVAIVNGIGEDAAADFVRHGMADIVSRARIARLPTVLERELNRKSRLAAPHQESRTAATWFSSVVRNLPIGLTYHNERREVVLCNATALELLGLTENELLGRTLYDPYWKIIRENGEPFPIDELPAEMAATTKTPVRNVILGVFRPITKDHIWLRVDAIPILDRENHVAHVVVQFSDITEQRNLSEALRTSEERFRSAFEHSGIGMFLANLDLEVFQANATACRLFERVHDDLVGRKVLDLTHPDDIDLSLQHRRLFFETGCRTLTLEKRYLKSTGNFFWAQATIDRVPDAHGNPSHFVVAIQDITARKEAEAERTRLQAQLLEAQKMEALGILAGGVAHDFNNILAAILCSADVLLHDLRRLPNTGELPEIVFELQTAAQRGADLVRQILTFSRKTNQKRSSFRLSAIIQETVSILKKTCPRSVEIRFTMMSNPVVLADTTQMQQVLTNLGTNAIHALEERGGTLSLSLEKCIVNEELVQEVPALHVGAYAHVRVSDNGPGMDENTLAHIFEPFFTTKRAGKGTGLGMAVVHGIIMAHEGAIRVQSSLGNGTTVDLWLPIAPKDASDEMPLKSPIPKSNAEHILLVDDEEGLARVFGRLLQSLGYRATVQTHSGKALELFEKNPHAFQAALVDLHMPPPGGIDVVKRLHELRPDLPIFIMSGYSDALGDASPGEFGAVGILQKPVSRETVANELRKALDRQAAK